MSEGSQNRKKRKAHFKKSHYSSKRPRKGGVSSEPTNLAPGMRGFIVTCNKRERQSGYEAVHLLEDALKRIEPLSDDEKTSESSSNDEDDDIEKAMRQETEKELKERKFNVVNTGVSNTIFITSSVENRSPTALTNEVFGELISARRGQPRFALRMLPVEAVCRTDDIAKVRQSCCDLWSDFIDHHRVKRPENPSFAVDFKSRNCTLKPSKNGEGGESQLLTKDAAVAAWVDAVKAKSPEYKVEMICPSVVLAVNIMRKCVCLSILEFKTEFAKYNLHEVIGMTADRRDVRKTGTEAKGSSSPDKEATQEKREKPDAGDAEED